MNGKTQHHRAIAPGVIAVTMFVLLVVNCNLKVSSAVLPRSDTWNIGITTRDLGGFTPKTTTRKYEEELYWASLSTELTADDQTQATGNYPQVIRQAVTFTRSPELAERNLDLFMMRRPFEMLIFMRGGEAVESLPIRPGRHEKYVKRWTSAYDVGYEVVYLINNVYIDTLLVGDARTLTEDHALEIAEISYKKYQGLLADRLTLREDEDGKLSFATFMAYLVRILVPVIGFCTFLVLYPVDERGRSRLIWPDTLSLILATIYAILLWAAHFITGDGGRFFFVVEGWGGALTVALTALVAWMGLRRLWEQRFAPLEPQPLASAQRRISPSGGLTSCPRCKRLSPSASPSCTACGLPFRGRA
ncbi:MAG TPA: hypothetical protein VFH48_38465 [Chloroflexota bacterium]|nr:hypothetical protein [Chloroflexota bacterium]